MIHSYLNHLNVAAQGRTDFNLLNSNTSEFNCLLYFIQFFLTSMNWRYSRKAEVPQNCTRVQDLSTVSIQ